MGMRINCEFATVRGNFSGYVIYCGAEKHGGKPTLVQCKRCKHFEHTSRGLGDRIERFTSRTGIKAIVKKAAKVTGRDCGCEGRRRKLNDAFPAKTKNFVYGPVFSSESINEQESSQVGGGKD